MKRSVIQQKVGRAFRKRREALKVSQEAFADSLGVHRTYYSAVERGEKDIRITTLERIAKGLGVRASDVIKDAEGGP